MQFAKSYVVAILASTHSAAASSSSKSMTAFNEQWTVEGMTRNCDGNGTCTWAFAIDTHQAPVTSCVMVVHGLPATHFPGGPIACGDFTITSGWSGQFEPEHGFTTLAVVENQRRLIIYPAYTDAQLINGKMVVPDQGYTPQALP